MAERQFTINLENDTPFFLRLQNKTLSDGDWGIDPPDPVSPKSSVLWKSQNDSLFHGTSGEIWYSIDDKDAILGSTSDHHSGGEGCLHIKWNNPILGAPGLDQSLGECDDLLNSKDASKDYILERSFGSADSEPMMGWKDTVLGDPFPIFGSGEIRVWYRLRTRVGVLSTSTVTSGLIAELTIQEPSPMLKLDPVEGGSLLAWIGDWGDNLVGATKLEVRIFLDDIKKTYSVSVKENYLSESSDYSAITVTQTRGIPYKEDVWNTSTSGNMMVTHIPNISLNPLQINETRFNPIQLPAVDIMTLDKNKSLQLYGDYDSGGNVYRNRIRFIDVGDDGITKIDVMLYPHSIIQ